MDTLHSGSETQISARIRSITSFVSPSGFVVESGKSSRIGTLSGLPYTVAEELNTISLTLCFAITSQSINVPVRLNSADNVKGIAAGRVTVTYPSTKCSFVAPTDKDTLDLGMFEEVEYYDDGNGTIKIVGNVSNITANKDAEGLYINLRFKVKDVVNQPVDDSDITVTYDKDHDFCEIEENVPILKVVRSAYNDFK